MFVHFILFFSLIISSQAFCDSLVGHWIFDETHIDGNRVPDLTGHHDAIIEGPMELYEESGCRGLIMNTLKIDDLLDGVIIPSLKDPSELPQNQITIEVTFCILGTTRMNGLFSYFEDKGNLHKGWGWCLGYEGESFYFGLSSHGVEDGFVTYLRTKSFYENRKWYHVAGTYDGITQKIYVNGKLENVCQEQSGPIHYLNDCSYVMGLYRDSDENRSSEIILLETRLHDRALSQEELLGRYQSLPSLPVPKVDPPVWQLTQSNPQATGIYRLWKNKTLSAKFGMINFTGNITMSSGLYLDGYVERYLPWYAVLDYKVEYPEKYFWSTDWDDENVIATYDLDTLGIKGKWIVHSLPVPISQSNLGLSYIPLDRDQIIYITKNQNLARFNIRTQEFTILKRCAETQLSEFWQLTKGIGDAILVGGTSGFGILTNNQEWKEHLLEKQKGPCIVERETDQGCFQGFLFEGTIIGRAAKGNRHPFLFDGHQFQFEPDLHESSSLNVTFYLNVVHTIQENQKQYSLKDEYTWSSFIGKSKNALWLYHKNQGTLRYAPALWRSVDELSTISTGGCRILEDSFNQIWFICYGTVAILKADTWVKQPFSKDWSLDPALNMGTLPNGKLYFTYPYGVQTYDPTTQSFSILFPKRNAKRNSACFGSMNKTSLWISNGSKIGLYRVDHFEPKINLQALPEKKFNSKAIWKISKYDISDIEQISPNEIWIGASSGLHRYRNGCLIKEGKKPLFSKSVREILKVSDGTYWIASHDSVYRFKDHQWTLMKDGLSDSTRMIETRDGAIWVCTRNGLYCYRKNSWHSFSVDEGLQSEVIYDILEDSQGRLWVSTKKGVCQYNKSADPDCPDTYVIHQGNHIHENNQSENIAPDGIVRIAFTGMDKWKYTETNRLLYSYRFDDNDWSPYSSETIVSATGMVPGKHVFRVKAIDRNWNEDPTPALFHFVVHPYWYQKPTVFFIVLTSFIIILVLLLWHLLRFLRQEHIISKRTNTLKEKEKELLSYQQKLRAMTSKNSRQEAKNRLDMATQIHHEIGHNLTLFNLKIDYMQKKEPLSDFHYQNLEDMKTLVKQLIDTTRNLTVELSPPLLHDIGLVQSIELLCKNLNEKNNMCIEVVEEGEPFELGMDERVTLYQCIKELLYNVIKHAQTSQAQIEIIHQKGAIQVFCRDNGVGFNKSMLGALERDNHNFGLFSIRERVEYYGGHFECRSTLGLGTQVRFQFPIQGDNIQQ